MIWSLLNDTRLDIGRTSCQIYIFFEKSVARRLIQICHFKVNSCKPNAACVPSIPVMGHPSKVNRSALQITSQILNSRPSWRKVPVIWNKAEKNKSMTLDISVLSTTSQAVQVLVTVLWGKSFLKKETCLCVSRSRKILLELLVQHFHHTRFLHAVHNLVGSFLSFLLSHIISFNNLSGCEVAFTCQPYEDSLIKRVPPVMKGMCHLCVCAAEPRPRQ